MIKEKIAVIFDMDGVIIDSNPLVIKAWEAFFNSHNIKLTAADFNYYVFGRTSKDTIQMVLNRQIDEKVMKGYCNQIDRTVRELSSKEGRIVEGFKSFVEALNERNVSLAIATSAPIENVELILKLSDCKKYFHIVVDASQVQHAKPNPEVYMLAAEKLKIAPANCCVFEDSFSGIEAAKSAGMKVIGVATTHSPQELQNKVDKVLYHFTEISPDGIYELVNG